MFEKLIEIIAGAWERLSPLEIVNAYQGAAVLRFGRYNRTLAPGLHWKWPVAESVLTVETCLTTLRLPPQTLTTKDDVGVVVAAIVKYQILPDKLEAYATEIWDQTDVLADVVMGQIRMAISVRTYAELIENQPPEQAILGAVRAEINRYGFKLHRITFTDLGRVKSLRLIQRTTQKVSN